jgi:hypothetical protein
MLVNDLFHQMGMMLKQISDCTEYLLDSFPVPMCDNIRIFNVKLIKSEEYRGYIASKKRYFYGVRVQLLTTKNGIRARICVYARQCKRCPCVKCVTLESATSCAKFMVIQPTPITLLKMTWNKPVKFL